MQYSLAKLALMTGYSTRSLRTFYRQGLLTGTMVDGKYSFSEEDLKHFMDQPFIVSGMKSKTRMCIQHFLEEDHTRKPATCLIHDEPNRERAEQLNNILMEYIRQTQPAEFTYTYLFDGKKDVARFIFIGSVKEAAAVLAKIE